MTKSVYLPHDIREQALQAAIQDGFPEVIRILRLFRGGSADVTADEAAHLIEFARFLVRRAELHYPYWDDSRTPYVQEHEDAFHEVNMGLHEKLVSYISSTFPELLA